LGRLPRRLRIGPHRLIGNGNSWLFLAFIELGGDFGNCDANVNSNFPFGITPLGNSFIVSRSFVVVIVFNDCFFGSDHLESIRTRIHRAFLFDGEINSSVRIEPRHDSFIVDIQVNCHGIISHRLFWSCCTLRE